MTTINHKANFPISPSLSQSSPSLNVSTSPGTQNKLPPPKPPTKPKPTTLHWPNEIDILKKKIEELSKLLEKECSDRIQVEKELLEKIEQQQLEINNLKQKIEPLIHPPSRPPPPPNDDDDHDESEH